MASLTAGQKLRRSLDSELRKAGAARGVTLAWMPAEKMAVDAAVAAADAAELLQSRFDALAAGGPDAGDDALLLKVAAELRQQRRAVADLVGRLEFGPDRAKSARHVRAARARWAESV
jgi:hypothetical protein